MPNRTILFGTVLFLVLVLGFIVSGPSSSRITSDQDFTIHIPPPEYNVPQGASIHEELTEPVVDLSDDQQHQALADVLAQEHITLSSTMHHNKQWFPLDFVGWDTYNPNILPHPHPLKAGHFIMIAQAVSNDSYGFLREIACAATFENGTMRCVEDPVVLPVASGVSDKCNKKLEPFNYLVGPHDARAFFGPDRPFLIYGSPSAHTCLGMWMQDLGRLHPWDYLEPLARTEPFFQPTDLQRPQPYAVLEKNWFAFWDRAGDMFLHYDVAPRRVFAKVNATGGVGPDLAPQAYAHDNECIAKYMPKINHPGYEHIHQATNSLMITLCDREDPTCFETEHNTFIMTIIQHKTQFQHDVYEPYVMLFKRTTPFELYAIGKSPLWINGRNRPAGSASTGYTKSEDQLFYVTSMSWKDRGKNYQGYLNDALFLSFGVEDLRSGAIDVLAGDLIKNLGICGS